jgi:hypothetical protein
MTVNVSKPAINVREKLAELEKPTGIAGEAMLRAETPQEQQALIGVGRRNVLINGDFRIAQRGSSGTVGASLHYVSDRWQHRSSGSVGGTTTYAQDVVDGTSRLKVTYSGATGNAYIQQPIEAQNLYGMWDNYVTVSFYTTDENPNIFAFGYNAGGTESTMLPLTRPTYLGNNRWSHTFFLASPSGGPREGNLYGLGLVFYPNSQNPPEDGTIEWWGMQFEKGSCATPFEHRSYGEELALCQRYYEKLTYTGGYQFVCQSINVSTASVEGFIPFITEKRVSPTVTSSGAGTWRVNALSNDTTAATVGWYTGTKYGVRGVWARSTGSHVLREASYINVENASPYEAYISIDAEL